MKKDYKVAFVILHYQLLEMTKVCVKCLEDNYKNYSIDIIVVDNASPNGSGNELELIYRDDPLVTVICNADNLGFSKGNNVGYAEARKRDADFIIVMNNDVEIQQKEFLDLMIATYEQKKCFVMGPDIKNLEGIHQSPQRDHFITREELNKWYKKRIAFLRLLRVSQKIKPLEFLVKKMYRSHDKERIGNFNYSDAQTDVELQGACFIFTPLFVQKRNYPFEEISFMYGEEPMMGVLCKNNGWSTYYNPKMKILHKEKSTTRNENKDYVSHEIFYTQNMVIGLKNILDTYF
jgi:GT2 family glycosyltransferase